jgi:hypothetical protein
LNPSSNVRLISSEIALKYLVPEYSKSQLFVSLTSS